MDLSEQLAILKSAALGLPLAACLGAILAFRPLRKGTPHRIPAVIQTQIILAVMGSMVMLVIGDSMARAFGIVGAAGLVRYRAKISDPKDAGVMLSTLAIGLATGVGQYLLAVFGTLFVLLLLATVESFEPKTYKRFEFKIESTDPQQLRPALEEVLRHYGALYELRSAASDKLMYEIQLPFDCKTDTISNAILSLGDVNCGTLTWDEKKKRWL
jgi:hypothetical protein